MGGLEEIPVGLEVAHFDPDQRHAEDDEVSDALLSRT